MSMTVRELAGHIGARVVGEGERLLRACAAAPEAGEHDVTLASDARGDEAARAAVLIVGARQAEQFPGRTLLVADDPLRSFHRAMIALHEQRPQPAPGISPRAFVDVTAIVGELCAICPFAYIAPRARIGKRCVIYPNCYVGKDAYIGDDCILYPNVSVYDGCVLSCRVIVHAGSVIGDDAFTFVQEADQHHKVPSAGGVLIEDDVEIGACANIQRALVGRTLIGRGAKLAQQTCVPAGARIEAGSIHLPRRA